MSLLYKEYGIKSADLIVFIHGGGVSGWMWDKQVEYFKNQYHCIVPDLPGHGLNRNINIFSIEDSAMDLIRIIEEKATGKKVILVGFSLGSQVIIQMLSIKSNLVDFAIINSALVRPMTYAKPIMKPTMNLFFPLIKNRSFSKLQAKTLFVSEDYFDKYYEETCQMKLETLVGVMRENMSFTIPKEFSQASTKILVTVGEKERTVMKKSVEDIIASNPNVEGILISQIGHGVPLAMPEFFNQLIDKWIKEGKVLEECNG
ncbi:alpha/beta fold hydrolase [Oceanobacillus sp. Castelsardo]|uniref:alpha/beta fold hydrolase n=1 Tax=Oceanobacillus sp. Castelsardo TaxID=1851204 RepID=UPI000838E6C2|nr:alpha/beta hydrolase [Oceanobacillus sp. Castelsardo]